MQQIAYYEGHDIIYPDNSSRVDREKYRYEMNRRIADFKADLVREYKVTPQTVDYAYREAHSDGIQAVIDLVQELITNVIFHEIRFSHKFY